MGRIWKNQGSRCLIYFTLLAAEHGGFSFFSDKLFVTCNVCLFEGIPKANTFIHMVFLLREMFTGRNVFATSGPAI